jgi:hypothetical protein|nr:MAG TPA: pentapeptide repeat protein [Caudoviricetes sp.]
MKKVSQKELKQILKNHRHWLRRDCDDWKSMKADLSDTDLSGMDLRFVNLYCANLRGSNLTAADLQESDLRYANLKQANLYQADLCQADLRGASLGESDLRCCNLYKSDLRYSHVRRTNFKGANLEGANLDDVSLGYAKNVPFIPYTCPDVGSFIGYKKANGLIVELEILPDSKRLSATGRDCRCNKAKVLSIQNIDKNIPCDVKEVVSDFDDNFVYKVGEIVKEPRFDKNRWHEYAKGIHFFINRQEAVRY